MNSDDLITWLKSGSAQWHLAEVLANRRGETLNETHNREASSLLDAVAKRLGLEERAMNARSAEASRAFQDKMSAVR